MTIAAMRHWTVIHKNSREHYATPRILHSIGLLDRMITDLWITPGWQRVLPFQRTTASRWHEDLTGAEIIAFNLCVLPNRLAQRLIPGSYTQRIEAEDRRFQRAAATALKRSLNSETTGICFSYAYTALESFRAARQAGWKTVLGQIDPGPLEWDIVERDSKPYLASGLSTDRHSPAYWRQWREETEIADVIVANSEWSAELLRRQGVARHKLRIIPLLYEQSGETQSGKSYTGHFCHERPLKVLFLGQICLRKGVAPLLDAMRQLRGEPIQLRLVGPLAMQLDEWLSDEGLASRVRVDPPANPTAVAAAYQWADVFVLPTLSDGFAMTQLEALASNVPVIVSERCARVIQHRQNGWVLPDISPHAIEGALRHVLECPEELSQWSDNAAVPERCRKSSLAQQFRLLSEELSR